MIRETKGVYEKMKDFPKLDSKEVTHFKILIILLLVLAIVICVNDNAEKILAHMGEHYEDTLPIYSVDTEEKVVSITFDAAWGDEDLEQILQILNKHDCKATFFVTGDWASRYPEAIKKIHQNGHDIGNHGANHKHMTSLSREEMIEEIDGCHNIIKSLVGVDMILFRPPYGDYNESVIMTAKAEGYYSIQWDVDSLDWKDYGVESIISTVCQHKSLKNGSIILLHNGSKYTALALDALLSNLENQGYSFVPVSELIYTENYSVDHAGRQYKQNSKNIP